MGLPSVDAILFVDIVNIRLSFLNKLPLQRKKKFIRRIKEKMRTSTSIGTKLGMGRQKEMIVILLRCIIIEIKIAGAYDFFLLR